MIITKFVYVRDFFVFNCEGVVGTWKGNVHPFLPFSAISSPRTITFGWVNSLGTLWLVTQPWFHMPLSAVKEGQVLLSGAAVVAVLSSGSAGMQTTMECPAHGL